MTTVGSFVNRGTRGFIAPNFDLPLPSCMTGVEVEVDQDSSTDVRFPQNFGPEWLQKYDGSLVNGHEYVLDGGLWGDKLVQAVYKLYAEPTKIERTFTGSTHIHIDMMDGVTMDQLRALTLLCYTMENMLYAVGDPTRKWCGYANQLISSPSEVLEALLGPESLSSFKRSVDRAGRYYGLNLAALDKYGSLEFRYFPTATSAEELLRWIKLCQTFKKVALDIGSAEAVIEKLSSKEGFDDMINTYFSDYEKEVASVGGHKKVKALMNKALIVTTVKKNPQKYNIESILTRFKIKTAKKLDMASAITILSTRENQGVVPNVFDHLVSADDPRLLVLIHNSGDIFISSPAYYRTYDSRSWLGKYDITDLGELQILIQNMDVIKAKCEELGYVTTIGSYFRNFNTYVHNLLEQLTSGPSYDDEDEPDTYEDDEEEY